MLDQILQATRARIDLLDREEIRARAAGAPVPRDFRGALAGPGLAVIAEIKRSSPSRGVLAGNLDPVAQALAYERGGAAAVSVLTEPDFFAGSTSDLEAVRAAVSIPVLCKDFILDPAQIWEARAAGADAVLLIVAALHPADLATLAAVTRQSGMEALVEVHTASEAAVAVEVGATVVGVNTRDLATFEVDPAVAEQIVPFLASVPVRVAESGIDGPEVAARMQRAGYQAVLVGEALVRSADPAALVADLRRVGEVAVP